MISFFPFQTMFLFTLISGTLTAISAPSWFLAWFGLEINLLSFIPLITSSTTNQEAEGAMKYFLSQATGSTLLLIGSVLAPSNATFILVLGLLIKLGLPPGHFWFPMVMGTLPWATCILLTTWQKVAPLTLLTFTPSTTFPLLGVVAGAASILGASGHNQSQISPLLAYSSIGHLGWMLMLSTVSPNTTIIYFVMYSLITLTIMLLLAISSSQSLYSLSGPLQDQGPSKILTASLLLSLAGLPPLLGFMPKLLTLNALAQSSLLIASMPLILGSLTNLFYYLSFSFILLLPMTVKQQTTLQPPTTFPLPLAFLIMLSLAASPLLPAFFM
uniref:NADH-ubiquinone oxidoreductase chain 2 n=1 Tax=Sipunculus nudus TaxID=6446 RepID=B8XR46_SIPNU|nr:NADH dehydrogenase subunit 2 [Sipunculus nudus]ACJ11903.1 NADH dehydrogenase subunit 2 [Sipunculus nudus]